MELTVRIIDTKTKEEINMVTFKKEILDYVLINKKFIFQESKYDVIDFVPGVLDASILVVNKVPNIYK